MCQLPTALCRRGTEFCTEENAVESLKTLYMKWWSIVGRRRVVSCMEIKTSSMKGVENCWRVESFTLKSDQRRFQNFPCKWVNSHYRWLTKNLLNFAALKVKSITTIHMKHFTTKQKLPFNDLFMTRKVEISSPHSKHFTTRTQYLILIDFSKFRIVEDPRFLVRALLCLCKNMRSYDFFLRFTMTFKAEPRRVK